MTMTKDEVVSVLGPVDDMTAAEIVATSATLEELREAFAWLHGDEGARGEGRPLPGPRVACLIDVLEPDDGEA